MRTYRVPAHADCLRSGSCFTLPAGFPVLCQFRLCIAANDVHGQPFSSRLSSFQWRQSVPSAMILFGLDLIMPASRSRSA
jgi:hypothetical protein